MRELAELQEKIQSERIKLDRIMEKAVETDSCDDEERYRASVRLDLLIEQYIELVNGPHLSV